MSIKNHHRAIFTVAIIALMTTIFGNVAHAAYYGTGSGSGGSPTCDGPFSTCYGATWKWYDWNTARNNGYLEDGIRVSLDGSDSLEIMGSTGNRQFIGAGKIDQDCSDRGDGFWRYAMVAKFDYDYGDSENGLQVYGGHQMGLLGIDQNANSFYDSEAYGGYTSYYEMGFPMDYVREQYNNMREQYGSSLYPITWDENGTSGPLAWFCAPRDPTASYLSLSNVSNSAVGGYSSTGINGTAPVKVVYTTDAVVNKNQPATITFSHNIYATQEDSNVSWKVERSGTNYGGFRSGIAGSGTANLTVAEDGYYAAENRSYSSGGSKYIFRESFNISFSTAGQYLFCETVSVGKGDTLTSLTKVCTKVIVGGGQPDTCGNGELVPYGTSYYNPASGITSVISKAKNTRLAGTYRGWQDDATYAMPGDVVAWQNCYFPGAQYYMYHNVTEWNGTEVAYHDSSKTSGCPGCGSYNGYIQLRNATDFDWISGYRVTTSSPYGFNDLSGNRVASFQKEFTYSAGNTTQRGIANNYRITNSDVDTSYNDFISTNNRYGRRMSEPITSIEIDTNHSWTKSCCSCKCPHHTESRTCTHKDGSTYTCSRCVTDGCDCNHTIYHCNTYNIGRTTRGSVSDSSYVHVPYNYYNTISLDIDRTRVFAGDEIAVYNAYVTVGTRYNNATEADYATIVPNARARLIGYVSTTDGGSEQVVRSDNLCAFLGSKAGLCNDHVETYSGTLNSNSYLPGVRNSVSLNGTYSAYDASAGDYMCFAAAVYPASSGADTNYYDVNGDGMWRISAPKCARIVKKPTLQVLGGSIFSNGEMLTGVTKKYNLYGIYNYTGDRVGATYFGSWVEEGIIANGLVRNLASGAALGRTGTNTIYGLSTRSGLTYNFCGNQVPLSFANFTSSSSNWAMLCGQNGSASGNANIHTNTAKNRTALVDYFMPSNPSNNISNNIILDYAGTQTSSGTGKDIRYAYYNGDLTISGGNVPNMATRVVKATGSITIAGDIYARSTSLTSSTQIPKIIISAAGDIRINCNVGRIDAILISGGTVHTCNGYSSETQNALNSRERSLSQLVINGVIIANTINPARTYGNAIGNQSGTPAEIINYDTSSLIWAHSMAEASESSVMTTVYQHELAPRY